MPTYEYKCDACGRAFEKFQSIKADPIKTCPHCGREAVRRLISAGGGFIFKGSGFYITDYRDKGYAEQAKADNGGKADAKSDGPSDAKSDKAADAKPADGTSSENKSSEGKSSDAKAAESKPAAAESKPAAPTPTPAPKSET